MSVIPYALIGDSVPFVGDPTKVYQWSPLTFSGLDSGQPLTGMGWSDRSIQVEGSFGGGGTIVIEGSNDGINWHTLHDPFSVPIVFTSAGLSQVTEISQFFRPRCTGGDGGTSLTVTGCFRTQALV